MRKLKGTLEFYSATGEQPRPQFIGKNACDKNGHIKNFDEVYDIAIGDEIRFLHPALKRKSPALISDNIYIFLYWLGLMWDQKVEKMEVEYTPSKTNFSWGFHSTKCPKCGAYSGTHNPLCQVLTDEGKSK